MKGVCMTHSVNGYVLAIRDSNKKILREFNGKVYLPFHSEYSLFIKNTGSGRALAKVEIDGTDVLGGERLVIPAYGGADLERFLPSDRKFKFVPTSDSRVQDPTSGENGIVKVTFNREYVNYQTPFTTYTNGGYAGGLLRSKTVMDNTAMFSCNVGATVNCCDMGATVEGSKSNQSFQHVNDFPTEAFSTVLTLQLLGNEAAVTVQATKNQYCIRCGAKVRFTDNFCGACGDKL